MDAALMAGALALVISGFLITLDDQPRWGGVILFAGAVAGILAVARPGEAEPVAGDGGVSLALLVVSLGLAPAVLVVIELFHPHGFADHTYQYLSRPHALYFGPRWWTALHLIQTPAVVVVGGGLFLVIRGIQGPLAWLSRIATLVFIVYYTVLDSIAGVAVGALIVHTKNWHGEPRQAAEQLVQFLFTNAGVGGVGSVISQIGSWAAFLAFLGIALTLARAGAPLFGSFLLAAAGVLLEISHTRPYGPLSFACVLGAALILVPWRRRLDDRRPETQPMTAAGRT
jgi:hypothetical protein